MSGVAATSTEPLDLERLDLDAFRSRRVAVLGLARSGIALARFLADRGAAVTVYDGRTRQELQEAVDSLSGRDVTLALGPEIDPAEVLAGQSLVATSPSVSSRYPTTEPRLRAALGALEAEGRVPVLSEVDLFLRLCPAPTIGVTGTKGKTTTSSLCAAVLSAAAPPVVLGGNIGIPLVERLPELTPEHRVVVELSELQLPTLSRGTTVAVYTHVTEDHLDRHGTAEAYRAVKRILAERVDPDGALVLNAEDPVSAGYASTGRARAVLYRRSYPMPGGIGVSGGWIVAEGVVPLDGGGARDGRILPLEAIPLPGEHNVSNILAAVAVGLLFGVAPDAIRAAVGAFAGVEHRLEPVGAVDGVRYVNDSQGTQPDAVIAALRSFPAPLVLICGGRDKGVPLDGLARVAVERAAAVVVMGETAPLLERVLADAGHPQVERADDLDDAVGRATARARAAAHGAFGAPHRDPEAPVATVLLSPAAASFDMFPDYAARGRAFKDAVARLAAEASAAPGDRGGER
jgi:UDP-N-acetylmuramoylalanine--D-glutamate ligase